MYDRKFEDLMEIMTIDYRMFADLTEDATTDDRSALPDNRTIDGLYSVVAGYTTFIHHIDEVKRDEGLLAKINNRDLFDFISHMETKTNHLYLLYPDELLNSKLNTAGLKETFKSDLYVYLLEGLENAEDVYTRTEMVFTLSRVIEDMFVHSVINKCGQASLSNDVIPLYINEHIDYEGNAALHIIVYETLED
jgi:hypothetical protein